RFATYSTMSLSMAWVMPIWSAPPKPRLRVRPTWAPATPSSPSTTATATSSGVRQFGTSSHDEAHEVAVDSLGNIYVIGETQGNLVGPSAGFLDVMLSKFDPDGNLLWHYQVGSTASDV